MELYILRHAKAVQRGTPGYPDDDRPLTEEGMANMEAASCGIRKLVSSFDIILTSPLQRAFATATITAQALDCTDRIEIHKALLTETNSAALLQSIEPFLHYNKVLVVGHEPTLSTFASTLLGSQMTIIEMKKGALCRIDIEMLPPTGIGTLRWLLTTKHLKQIGK